MDLLPLSELSGEQRERFRDLENAFALLVPRPPLRTNVKAVDRETAELFRGRAVPSVMSDDVIDLVLDGMLEIETDHGFVCGAEALAVVSPQLADVEPRGLSREALLHAQDLVTDDPEQLTRALYLYNRIPLSPFWSARFAGMSAVLPSRELLESRWAPMHDNGSWLVWSAPSARLRAADEVTYKLYVSPRPERVRDALSILVRVLAADPVSFKIGNGAAALLRPDKIVAYFATREQLLAVADELRRELAGCEAQGVPFTAGLDDDGLLSWGVDPPDTERALRWLGRDSWRLWLAKRLGAAMSVAKLTRGSSIEPWRFALERVRRHGVDVDTWTPAAALWSRA